MTLQALADAIPLETGAFALCLVALERPSEVRDLLGPGHPERILGQLKRRAQESGLTVYGHGSSDRFILLHPLLGDVARTAESLLQRLEGGFSSQDVLLDIKCVVGMSLCSGEDARTLIEQAEIALRQARWDRLGWASFDAAQTRERSEQLALVADLQAALLKPDELMLFYQPKVEATTGRLTGVEALVRWQHPTRGFMTPDRFIPLAERAGLIQPLTRWVLNEALRQAHEWRASGLEIVIAVNVCARSLQDPTLPACISEHLLAWGVPPQCLEIELTESAMLVDPWRALETLRRLQDLGIRLSLDDFGTGFSSLSHLKALPVHTIKIDRSFVMGNLTAPADAAIVRALIDLAHQLRLTVVAEGVETREAWDKLVACGCDSVQGYYISRPLPASGLRVADFSEARIA